MQHKASRLMVLVRSALDRLRSRRQHAIAGIDDIAAITLSLIVLSGSTWIFGMGLRNTVNSFTIHSQHQAILDFRSELRADEDHAKWIGIPSTDIHGAANADGHEIGFYTTDSTGRPYFWSWYYDGTANTVTRYTYSNSSTHSGLTADSQAVPLTGATAFAVTSTKASAFSNPFLSGQGVTDTAAENLGYAGMNVSNNTITVTVSNANEVVPIEIAPHIGPTGYTVVVGTYLKPGPLLINPSASGNVVIAQSSTTCAWSDGSIHNPCTIGLSEEYYTGSIAISATNCGAGISVTPPSQTANSTTSIPFNIGAPSAPQNCTVSFADDHGGSATGSLTVTGTLVVNPTSIVGYVGKSYSVTASEANYFAPLTVNGGTCSSNGITGIAPASQNANGTTPVTFTVTGSNAGTCQFAVADNHGQSVTVTVTITNPPGPLSVNPTNITLQSGGATQSVTATDPNYTSAFTISNNTCAGLGATVTTANGPSGTIIVRSGGSTGTCTFQVGDGYNAPVSVTVTIVPPAPVVNICSDQANGTVLPYNASNPNMSGGSGNVYHSAHSACGLSVPTTSYSILTGNSVTDSATEWDMTSAISVTACGNVTVSTGSLPGAGSTSGQAGGSFTIRGASQGTCSVAVRDAWGQTVNITVTVTNPTCAAGTIGTWPTCYPGTQIASTGFRQLCSGPGDGTGGCFIPAAEATVLYFNFTTAPTTAANELKIQINECCEVDSPVDPYGYPGMGTLVLYTPTGQTIYLPSGTPYYYYNAAAAADTYTISYQVNGVDPSSCYSYGYNPATGGPFFSNCQSDWNADGYMEQI